MTGTFDVLHEYNDYRLTSRKSLRRSLAGVICESGSSSLPKISQACEPLSLTRDLEFTLNEQKLASSATLRQGTMVDLCFVAIIHPEC